MRKIFREINSRFGRYLCTCSLLGVIFLTAQCGPSVDDVYSFNKVKESQNEALSLTSTEGQDVYPKILVHGWGPNLLTNYSKFKRFFERDGFPTEHLHEFRYDYKGGKAEITESIALGFEEVFSRYPEGTRFDVIGHSLGTIGSLLTMMEKGISHKFRKYISIAGVDFGQNKQPANCNFGNCTDIYDLFYPYMSPFVVEFMEKYTDELSVLEKCSLNSPRDRMLDPNDANEYPDGVNISVPEVGHINFIRRYAAFAAMKEYCYGGKVD